MTDDALNAGALPETGEDEVGFYLALDGVSLNLTTTTETWTKDWDLRARRTLRGSDRTMGLIFKNLAAVNGVVYAFSFRMLVSYG